MFTQINRHELEAAIGSCITITRRNSQRFQDGIFPQIHTIHGRYPAGENWEWTPGFFTGLHWLCYELCGENDFRQAAMEQVDSFYSRVQRRYMTDNHDLGFLYTPSCVAAHMLTGSEKAKQAALLAANELMRRFQEKGQFIQAWGEAGNPAHYRMIIDCMLNLPLLYWASAQTGCTVYREKALAHSRTAIQYLFRQDGSTYHTFFFHPDTGTPSHGETAQGYSNDTAWARGQAWGIYGLALYLRHTGDEAVVPLFEKTLDYYLAHLPPDGIPYWDLSLQPPSAEPRDSSAAAIAACGVLEMAAQMDGDKRKEYLALAEKMAGALAHSCQPSAQAEQDGLLLHGVYNRKSPFNARENAGVDESNLWGDYFWLELLARLKGQWEPYW